MNVIPPDQLQPETLRALVEELVTREGAVHGHAETSVDSQVIALVRQIHAGEALIIYDEESESCGVMSVEQFRAAQTSAATWTPM